MTSRVFSSAGLLKSTHKTLSADLPRIHDRDAEGKAFGQHTSNNAHQTVWVNGLQDLITQQVSAAAVESLCTVLQTLPPQLLDGY